MAKTRQNQFGVLVGRRGCGKSTYLLALILKYHKNNSNKLVLIYDRDENDIFEDIPVVPLDYVPALKKGLYRCIDPDYKTFVHHARWELKNALILLEDASKYLQHVFGEVSEMIYACKQRNNDVLFTFHSFADTRPVFFRTANYITIFKTGEQWKNIRGKLPSPHLIKPVFEQVNNHKSRYYNKSIRIN